MSKKVSVSGSVIAMATATASACPFKVGDIVTGKANNGAIVTNEDWLGEVTAIHEEDGTFDAKFVAHRQNNTSSLSGKFEGMKISRYEIASSAKIAEMTGKKTKKKGEKPTKVYKYDNDFVIKSFDDGAVESNFNVLRQNINESGERKAALEDIMAETDRVGKKFVLRDYIKANKDKFKCFDDIFGDTALEKALDDLIKFFVEFQYEPNFRFVNTLSLRSADSIEAGKKYIENYFKLSDNSFADAIRDKMKSPEFTSILNILAINKPGHVVNSRLKVYYGSQGTGKTTMAMQESENRCVACHSDIHPQNMLEDFDFDNEGRAGFIHSAVCRAIEEGKTIVLDEINLLPFDTLRFLQSILDGKPSFDWKGETVKIHPDFNIIATMNLCVNGSVFGLPEPLVDRCSEIVEFNLSAKQLLGAF